MDMIAWGQSGGWTAGSRRKKLLGTPPELSKRGSMRTERVRHGMVQDFGGRAWTDNRAGQSYLPN